MKANVVRIVLALGLLLGATAVFTSPRSVRADDPTCEYASFRFIWCFGDLTKCCSCHPDCALLLPEEPGPGLPEPTG